LGIKVPDDLAIFGHDDIPISSWVTPSLSTCRVNFEQMGREAAKLLISYIGGCAGEFENLVMEPKLIIRESSH
ncbi:MAG: substrate-binding domain-containing protein, partial [Anaerolineales bacterium]